MKNGARKMQKIVKFRQKDMKGEDVKRRVEKDNDVERSAEKDVVVER